MKIALVVFAVVLAGCTPESIKVAQYERDMPNNPDLRQCNAEAKMRTATMTRAGPFEYAFAYKQIVAACMEGKGY